MKKRLQARNRLIALFGLLFLSIFAMAAAVAALATLKTPLAIVVPAGLAVLFVLTGSGLRMLGSQLGVTAVTMDSSLNLRTMKYTHSAALSPGDPIVVNGSLVIAVNKTAANEENVFIYGGKINLPKTAALAISGLDKVYWDATNSEVNKTLTGNTACGICVEDAAAADSTVTILLEHN